MKIYCNTVGLPFSDKILTWEPKLFPEWKLYPNYEFWHKSVSTSTGFMKNTERQQMEPSVHLLPQFEDAVKKAMPYYEQLKSIRINPSKQVP